MSKLLWRCWVTNTLPAELAGSFQLPVGNDPNPTWGSFSLTDLLEESMGWERERGGKGAAPALVAVRKEGWIFKNPSGGSWEAAVLLLGCVGLWEMGLPGGKLLF